MSFKDDIDDEDKTPIYKRLENMIDTLAKIRAEKDLERVPKFEQAFILRNKKLASFQRRESKRLDR